MILDLLTKKYPGFRLWFLQRISGLIIAIFSMIFIARLYFIDIHTFQGWKFFFTPFWMQVLFLLTWVCICFHGWIGVRNVIKDYIRYYHLRIFLLNIIALASIAYIFIMLWILY
jgi:succinate dehydrogenase / fumarate reductase membrane anchor subunit